MPRPTAIVDCSHSRKQLVETSHDAPDRRRATRGHTVMLIVDSGAWGPVHT
uniref:Uncharacterized protein n=1 Tax=Mycolicibacterium neoaurum VKM Ac-1815D TaxID=700508 RepID=V5XHM8_MYCNE